MRLMTQLMCQEFGLMSRKEDRRERSDKGEFDRIS